MFPLMFLKALGKKTHTKKNQICPQNHLREMTKTSIFSPLDSEVSQDSFKNIFALFEANFQNSVCPIVKTVRENAQLRASAQLLLIRLCQLQLSVDHCPVDRRLKRGGG